MADLVPYTPHRQTNRDPLDTSIDLDGRPATSTEFVGVREYLAMVRRHWWVVILTLVLSVAYTVNSAVHERPRYSSQSTVRLVDSKRAIAGEMAQPATSQSFSYTSDPIESQIQILQSEAVATVAVDLKGLRLVSVSAAPFPSEITETRVSDSTTATTLNLVFSDFSYAVQSSVGTVSAAYGAPADIDGIHFVVARKPTVAGVTLKVIPRDEAIGRARGGFSASGRPKTDILDFTYTGPDPYEAERIVNSMAHAFQAYNASSAQQLSKLRRTFLVDQLRQTDSMLNNATAAYTAFRSGRQTFNSAAKATAQESGLLDIDTRRGQLDADKTTMQKLLEQTKQGGSKFSSNLRVLASSPAIASNPVVSQYYKQLMDYEKAKEDLITAGAAPTNPDVIAVASLIPSTSAKFIDAVESQLLSLQSQIDALDRQRAAGATKVAALPAAEVQETDLTENVASLRQMSRQLQDELRKARMSEAVETGQVEIVQLAHGPGYEIATGKRRKLLTGILFGLIVGFGAAVLLDSFNASIRRRSDIERLLGIPGLAVIPRLSGAGGPTGWIGRALPARKNGRGTLGETNRNLVTITQMQSSASESFRNLRTNLMFSQAVGSMRTLVVTSASPSEGKTTTASNLAVSFAQQGMRVLLADCDLRRANIHRLFGIPREPGMSDMVLGYETEASVTTQTTVPGLYVIPAGKLPPNPSELLAGEGMRVSLAKLTEGYDVIVIDTPPLLAASDAAIVATLSDGVIMVLRAGKTDIAAALQATQQLTAVGARIVGAVLNDPDAQVPKYGAYYTYEYAAPVRS